MSGPQPALLPLIHEVRAGGLKVRDAGTSKVRKGLPVQLFKMYCFLSEELLHSPLNLRATLAQLEYPTLRIMSHLFHESRKPKSDCIQHWGVGDTLKAFQFPSHDQNEMFSHQAFHILEFNYKTLPFSLLGWQPHPRKSDKRQSLQPA